MKAASDPLAWCFGCHGLRPMTADAKLRVEAGVAIREAKCKTCTAPVWRVGGAKGADGVGAATA